MIFARRSRSASAWRAIARCIPVGISTSFTSTIETFTPQGEVASSMMLCRIELILSRSERSSSSMCCPSTDRRVVCEIWEVAAMKFSTCTIAAFGSMIRKYATALTLTGTLSFVITSCGGMFSVIVRRSTLTIRSTIGIRKNSPGPFGSASRRPSRKTMARSYSRATLSAPIRNSTTTSRTTTSAMTAAVMGRSYSDGMDVKRQPVEVVDLHALAGAQRLGGPGLPELAVDEHEPAVADDALHPDDVPGPGQHGRPPHRDRLRDRPGPEA